MYLFLRPTDDELLSINTSNTMFDAYSLAWSLSWGAHSLFLASPQLPTWVMLYVCLTITHAYTFTTTPCIHANISFHFIID
jgi:hypothetical protein